MSKEIVKKSSYNDEYEEKDYSSLLSVTPEQVSKLQLKLSELRQPNAPNTWEEPNCTIHWIPVDDGEIRVLHIKPDKIVETRPLIFIGGWQTMAYQFPEAFEIFYNRVEVYFVESRESYTSKLNRWKADMSVNQKAKDIQNVIDYFNLENQDYVLFGTCWGAAILLQGLIDQTIKPPPTIAVFSPMHKLWINKFFLKVIGPLLPAFLVAFLLKIVPVFLLAGEKAKTQKNRMFRTIKEAKAWKWKKAALATRNFNLFGKLSAIQEEVIVIGGTDDRVHKAHDYPRFADEMQNGRYFYFGIDESQRELTLGFLLLELAKVKAKDGIPEIFKEFERQFT
ncbi:MAG: alpha/beta hydrolase [Asgard group archaeon]|nr:alpha/beta hydrolase [Asgard group archaeon]